MDVVEYYEAHGAKAARQRVIPGELHGRTANNYSFTVFEPRFCEGVKGDGSACKARPVKNGMLCWFHFRQAERIDGDVN